MKRSKKKYKRPQMLWNKARIERDKELKRKFGLIRKREIWSAETFLRKYRRLARKLVRVRDKETEKVLITKLAGLGVLSKGSGLDDILGLTVEDVLERRFQTILSKAGMANTPKQARQMIVHGHVKVNGRISKSPSRLITKEEENNIELSGKVSKGA